MPARQAVSLPSPAVTRRGRPGRRDAPPRLHVLSRLSEHRLSSRQLPVHPLHEGRGGRVQTHGPAPRTSTAGRVPGDWFDSDRDSTTPRRGPNLQGLSEGRV